jgi:hypothetical protein
MRELRYYEELKEYIKAKAPRVAQMQQPITLDQSIEIQAGFEQDVIFATLLDMQRNENMTTDFTSAFYAFKLFTSGREYMKPRRSRGWSKPRPIATRILNEASR